jgi:hypothetical protein
MNLLRFTFLLLLAALPSLTYAQQALNDDAVIKLVTAGLGDDLIIQTINSQPGNFSTSAEDLSRLKSAGVSDRVLGAIIGKTMAPTAPAVTTLPSGIDEVGVYYKDQKGKWQQLSPEIINFKSGGVMKSIATNGILKGDKNGHIPGKAAKLTLTRQTDILLYVPEGISPEEYQLLKLRVNSDNREFRSQTGGVFHSSSGADRDSVAFKASKIAPRMYQFTLAPDLVIGEYGIIPPGAVSTSNAASAGKMYTFSILE